MRASLNLVRAAALSAALAIPMLHSAAQAADETNVVYHMVDGLEQARRGIGNIRNHLRADPSAHIVVVGHGDGILFMLDGAKDKNGNPFEVAIQDLASQGVEFRVCRNTLVARRIDEARVLPEARVVQSGVAEIARLQAKEAYSYLRP